jgi:hypothetical protein
MKPKGDDIVGWSRCSTWEKDRVTVIAERDVSQSKNARAGRGQTWSSGHYVRQLGFARRVPHVTTDTPQYHIYTHSQVSNGDPWMQRPPVFVGLTADDLEWLWAQISQELFGDKS